MTIPQIRTAIEREDLKRMTLEPITDNLNAQERNVRQDISSGTEEPVGGATASACELFEGGLGI